MNYKRTVVTTVSITCTPCVCDLKYTCVVASFKCMRDTSPEEFRVTWRCHPTSNSHTNHVPHSVHVCPRASRSVFLLTSPGFVSQTNNSTHTPTNQRHVDARCEHIHTPSTPPPPTNTHTLVCPPVRTIKSFRAKILSSSNEIKLWMTLFWSTVCEGYVHVYEHVYVAGSASRGNFNLRWSHTLSQFSWVQIPRPVAYCWANGTYVRIAADDHRAARCWQNDPFLHERPRKRIGNLVRPKLTLFSFC